MTTPREAAETLARARAAPGRTQPAQRNLSPSAPPAPSAAPACADPSPAASAPRGRPAGTRYSGLPIPLDALHMARLERLEHLVGPRYLGWGRESESRLFFVDVQDAGAGDFTRHHGATLHLAIGAALREAEGGARAA